jgi:hypothetical protein
VRCTVYLNREFGRRAIKVEHISPDWMLPAETDFGAAQANPQELLG